MFRSQCYLKTCFECVKSNPKRQIFANTPNKYIERTREKK